MSAKKNVRAAQTKSKPSAEFVRAERAAKFILSYGRASLWFWVLAWVISLTNS
jgi:hypothetical protein